MTSTGDHRKGSRRTGPDGVFPFHLCLGLREFLLRSTLLTINGDAETLDSGYSQVHHTHTDGIQCTKGC